MIAVADALGDLLVVVYGTACAFGINMDPISDEIHRSNMTKFIGGVKKTAAGKYLKGDHYSAPNLAPLLATQGYEEP